MKKLLLATAIISVLNIANAAEFKSDDEKISYAIGMQIGASLKGISDTVEISQEQINGAISDILADKEPLLNPEESASTMKAFQEKMIKAQGEKQAKTAASNLEEGKKFLEENKKVEGVKVTESGLQYRVIKEGTGKKPSATDTVSVNYTGTLPDGTKFDSSYDRNEPAEFPLSNVIKGWTEGLQLMTEGSKYEFVIPTELAYGDNAPASIGPKRALKFEVELLKVIDKPAE